MSIYKNSLIALVVAVVITIAVVSWQVILSVRLKGIETEISSLTTELAGLADANAKQIYLKSRLKLIADFLDQRKVARQALQRVFSISSEGVIVSGATFESEQVMAVQFSAQDVFALERLLDLLGEDTGFYLQVVSKGISRVEDGGYQLDVLMTIPQEAV